MFETLLQSAPAPPRPLEPVVAALEALPVGARLAAALAELPGEDSRLWDDPFLQLRVGVLWSQVGTWVESCALARFGAGQERLLASGEHVDVLDFVATAALATRSGERSTGARIALGVELRGRSPLMRVALSTAALTVGHARTMQHELTGAGDAIARQIDDTLTPRAVEREWTPSQLARVIRRMLLRLDPDGGAARHDQALDRLADVTGGPGSDGLGWIDATGDAITVADILHEVDTRAGQLASLAPDTPVGRLRFAALGDLILRDGFTLFDHTVGTTSRPDTDDGAADEPGQEREAQAEVVGAGSEQPRPTRRRRREVLVTIDLPTLLALRDEPAQVTGFGAVPAALVRAMLGDAALRRLVLDPVDGDVLDVGRRAYVPSDPLVVAVRARQGTCAFPGCTRARQVEIDHRQGWVDDGVTSQHNLQPLCRRHHTLKTAGRWHCRELPDGRLAWTGPRGETATRHPDQP